MKVSIKPKNMIGPNLFESDEVGPIIIRDKEGRPILIVVHIIEDTWGIATPNDEDWEVTKDKCGIK
jgi:hypothetical protein